MSISKIKQSLDILGIPYDVDFTIEDVKSSFKVRSKFYHPDMNKVSDANQKFIKLKEASDYLTSQFSSIKTTIKNNPSAFDGSIKHTTSSNQNSNYERTQSSNSQQTDYQEKMRREKEKRRKREEEMKRKYNDSQYGESSTYDEYQRKSKEENEEQRLREEKLRKEREEIYKAKRERIRKVEKEEQRLREEKSRKEVEEFARKKKYSLGNILRTLITAPFIFVFTVSAYITSFLILAIPIILVTEILFNIVTSELPNYSTILIVCAVIYGIFILFTFNWFVIEGVGYIVDRYKRMFYKFEVDSEGVIGLINIFILVPIYILHRNFWNGLGSFGSFFLMLILIYIFYKTYFKSLDWVI